MIDVGLLDMDGVLADFVGGICRAHGREWPYNYPHALGVFDVNEIWGMSPGEFWAPVNDDPKFWDELEEMPDALEIVELANAAFAQVGILTSPSMDPQCVPGKRRWIRKHFPRFKDSMVFTGAKHLLAHPGSCLVDDRDKNVEDFTFAGGHAILVPRPWNAMHSRSALAVKHVSDRLSALRGKNLVEATNAG